MRRFTRHAGRAWSIVSRRQAVVVFGGVGLIVAALSLWLHVKFALPRPLIYLALLFVWLAWMWVEWTCYDRPKCEWFVRRCRAREGQCLACGYDLRASPGRCPECGAENAG